MIFRSLTVMVILGITVTLVPPVTAGPPDGPVLALHVQAHAEKDPFICGVASPSDDTETPALGCSEYNTRGSLRMSLDVYLVVARAESTGISGVTFGIDYEGAAIGTGLDILNWTSCTSGLEFASDGWPGPATGNIVTWLIPADCQTQAIGSDGVHAVVGSFYCYAYSDDILRVREHPLILSEERLAIANCAGATRRLDPDAGITASAGFTNGVFSCNPCMAPCAVPVRSATWGSLKKKYRTF